MPAQSNNSVGETSTTKSLNSRIGLYSLAATAAGVSVLALASPVAGEVVITRKTVPIPLTYSGHGVEISLTNNGMNGFRFSMLFSFSSNTAIDGRMLVMKTPSQGRGVVGANGFRAYASALVPGANIGPKVNFLSSGSGFIYDVNIERSYTATYYRRGFKHLAGRWGSSSQDRYIGVRFPIDGQMHYGWIRLTVKLSPNPKIFMTATITEYAYETIPNKAISAGATGTATSEIQAPENPQHEAGPSLGALALGSDGVALWRRREPMISK